MLCCSIEFFPETKLNRIEGYLKLKIENPDMSEQDLSDLLEIVNTREMFPSISDNEIIFRIKLIYYLFENKGRCSDYRMSLLEVKNILESYLESIPPDLKPRFVVIIYRFQVNLILEKLTDLEMMESITLCRIECLSRVSGIDLISVSGIDKDIIRNDFDDYLDKMLANNDLLMDYTGEDHSNFLDKIFDGLFYLFNDFNRKRKKEKTVYFCLVYCLLAVKAKKTLDKKIEFENVLLYLQNTPEMLSFTFKKLV